MQTPKVQLKSLMHEMATLKAKAKATVMKELAETRKLLLMSERLLGLMKRLLQESSMKAQQDSTTKGSSRSLGTGLAMSLMGVQELEQSLMQRPRNSRMSSMRAQ